MSDLAQHMAGVAREILGEPNRHLSSEGRELRWGSGGSVSVDVRKGTVFDHELNEGGGVLWLIEQRLGLKGRDAFEWMSEHGFRVDAHADTRPRRQEPQRPAPKPEPQARAPKPEPGGEWAFLGLSADTKLVRTYDYTNEAGEQGLKTRFVLPALTIGRDADGDEIRSCTIAEPDEGELTGIDQSTPAEGGSLSPQAFNFVRALDKAVEEHGVEATSVGVALPYGMRVVDFTHFREVFAATSFEGADEADPKTRANTIRKAIKRNGEKLMAAGVIGRKDPYIWRTGKAIKGSPNPDADVPQNGDPVPPNGASGPISWGDLSP